MQKTLPSTKQPTTKQLTKQEGIDDRKWHIVDISGLTLGRAATTIASILRGKHKPTFTKHVDSGDFVVVINASKVHLSGKKLSDKVYYRHTGFPGGIVGVPAGEMIAKKPAEPIKKAVWGMLPKGPLGRQLIKKLKVYGGAEHPHGAQLPTELPAHLKIAQ